MRKYVQMGLISLLIVLLYKVPEFLMDLVDNTIGKLNLDGQGNFLGSFNTDELILVIYEDGTYELNPIDFSKRYNMKDIILMEKYNVDRICSIVYKNGKS